MNNIMIMKNNIRHFWGQWWQRILLFLAVFGSATITAMADNDTTGVATYSISGAQLGYPILFLLLIITILLAVTQEMGMRLTLVTRRGLADLIQRNTALRLPCSFSLPYLLPIWAPSLQTWQPSRRPAACSTCRLSLLSWLSW